MAAAHWLSVNLETLTHGIIKSIAWAMTGSIVTGPVFSIGNQYLDNLIHDLTNGVGREEVSTDNGATDYTLSKDVIPNERGFVYVEMGKQCRLGEYAPGECVLREICGPPYAICATTGQGFDEKKTLFRFPKTLMEMRDLLDELRRNEYVVMGACVVAAGVLLVGIFLYIWGKKRSRKHVAADFPGEDEEAKEGESFTAEGVGKIFKWRDGAVKGGEAELTCVRDLEKQLRKSRAETKNAKTSLDAAKQKVKELEANQTQSGVEGTSDKMVENLKAENRTLKCQLEMVEGQLKASRESNAALNTVLMPSMEEVKRLKALEQELEDIKANRTLTVYEMKRAQEALRKAKEQIEKLQAEKNEAEEKLHMQNAEMEKLKAQQKLADEKHNGEVGRIEKEIENLKCNLIRTEDELARKLGELEDVRKSKGNEAVRKVDSVGTHLTAENENTHDDLSLQDVALKLPGSARNIWEAEAQRNTDEAELEEEKVMNKANSWFSMFKKDDKSADQADESKTVPNAEGDHDVPQDSQRQNSVEELETQEVQELPNETEASKQLSHDADADVDIDIPTAEKTYSTPLGPKGNGGPKTPSTPKRGALTINTSLSTTSPGRVSSGINRSQHASPGYYSSSGSRPPSRSGPLQRITTGLAGSVHASPTSPSTYSPGTFRANEIECRKCHYVFENTNWLRNVHFGECREWEYGRRQYAKQHDTMEGYAESPHQSLALRKNPHFGPVTGEDGMSAPSRTEMEVLSPAIADYNRPQSSDSKTQSASGNNWPTATGHGFLNTPLDASASEWRPTTASHSPAAETLETTTTSTSSPSELNADKRPLVTHRHAPSGIPQPKLKTGLAGKRVSPGREVERPVVKQAKVALDTKEVDK